MPPNQPPASNSDPYNFIMNPQRPTGSKPSLPRSKGLLFVIGVVAFVVIFLVIILSLVRGGSGDSKSLLTVLQRQQEISRIAGLQQNAVRQDSVKNFVTTTKMTVASDQVQLQDYAAKNGIKVSSKDLAKGQNITIDTQLTDAVSTNTLDNTLSEVLQAQLKTYQSELAAAYQANPGPKGRALLVEFNDHAKLLITQSQQ